MRHFSLIAMLWVTLATPMLAMADSQTMPPETNWTAPPPGRAMVDVHQLTRVLVDKGVITPQEYTQLTQPQSSSPATYRRGRVWTWDDIDHDPVRSTGGD